jgi:hypothetical protein
MRHTEFWARMDAVLGPAYSRVWARQQVVSALEGRTVEQALSDGVPPKRVWQEVAAVLAIPESQR